MQYLEDKIKINIFKYVEYPFNLSLTCRSWSVIAKDPYAKTEWLLVHYRKAHALYHAVRLLDSTFIGMSTCQALTARKVVISKYFIQRLLMHFGSYDSKLTQLEIGHNVSQFDIDRIRAFQQKIKSIWASDLPTTSKGNYMELFHLLSAVCHVINHARIRKKNLKYIRNLISNTRPKVIQIDDPHIYQPQISQEYSSKSYCENSKPNLSKFTNFSGQESFLR
jgi:hypothetical protein